MGSLLVVFDDPIVHYISNLAQSIENIEIQNLIAKCSVETLNVRILCGLTRLNKFQFYTVLFRPACKLHRNKSGPLSMRSLAG